MPGSRSSSTAVARLTLTTALRLPRPGDSHVSRRWGSKGGAKPCTRCSDPAKGEVRGQGPEQSGPDPGHPVEPLQATERAFGLAIRYQDLCECQANSRQASQFGR